MATADDASSAWIYLREALVLAVAAFGRSEKRAKKRLLGWLGTEDLPWTCDDEDWRAPDSVEIAQRNRYWPSPTATGHIPCITRRIRGSLLTTGSRPTGKTARCAR
jgi:hypothetical protein